MHDDFKPIRKVVNNDDIEKLIKNDVKTNNLMLYMKGNPEAPMCGFSNHVCKILEAVGVEYHSRNVLESDDLREGIKKFSDWPTIPQLYVKGEFIGGCDIVTEMMLSGELDTLLEDNGVAFDKDAADKIREANG